MAARDRRRLLRALLLLAILAVAGMIFLFSAQSGAKSKETSDRVTDAALSIMVRGYKRMTESQRLPYRKSVGLIIRKAAHFSEFALLSALLALYIDTSPRRRGLRLSLPLSWLLATLYACTDEIHQQYVSGRGPALLDVGIDSLGAVCGALIALALLAWARQRKRA